MLANMAAGSHKALLKGGVKPQRTHAKILALSFIVENIYNTQKLFLLLCLLPKGNLIPKL